MSLLDGLRVIDGEVATTAARRVEGIAAPAGRPPPTRVTT